MSASCEMSTTSKGVADKSQLSVDEITTDQSAFN
jgi:hypothetical protein